MGNGPPTAAISVAALPGPSVATHGQWPAKRRPAGPPEAPRPDGRGRTTTHTLGRRRERPQWEGPVRGAAPPVGPRATTQPLPEQ